jgi:hypothetical protein
MTFAEWYSTNIEPAVIRSVNQIPDVTIRAGVLKASRDSMAACWNAAIEEAQKHTSNGLLPLKVAL